MTAMAKDKKKAKSKSKATPQIAKKAAKPAPAKAKKPAAAASAGKKAADDAKRKASSSSGKVTAKPEKKLGKAEKAKKKGKAVDDEDDFLPEEAEGGEELPDLSDFEEEESQAEEPDDAALNAIEAEEAQGTDPADEEVILTDAEGRRYCKVKDCDQIASVEGYCRYHYLLLWKRIQVRRKILADGKLERYVEELTSRYPDKFLEMIRRDLKTEKDFLSAIAELEIDESAIDNEFEDEAQSYIDEVRGVAETSGLSEEEEF